MNYPRIYKEYEPHPHLRQSIRCYWRYEREFTKGEYQRVFPDSSYELFYNRGASQTVGDKVLPSFFLVNQLAKPADFYATGMVKGWAIRLYPWGLLPFGRIDAVVPDATWTPAKDILGAASEKALDAILDSDNDAQVIAALDAYFIERLLAWEFGDTRLQKALATLQSEDIPTIQDLADSCFMSRRQLHRKITVATGRSPRDIAIRLRFEKVRDALMHQPAVSLTWLAQQHGYTDQSHLIREFRRFTDMTPSTYAALFKPLHPKLQNEENVRFVQS